MHPGDADDFMGFTSKMLLEVLLKQRDVTTEIAAQFDGKERSDHLLIFPRSGGENEDVEPTILY
jgi:hypothetical protein